MIVNWLRPLAIVIALTSGVCAHASLIAMTDSDGSEYVYDSSTGLDWLKLTDSRIAGMSYNDVVPLLSAGGSLEGWQYATIAQFAELFTNVSGTSYSGGYQDTTQSIAQAFFDVMGNTSDFEANVFGYPTFTDYQAVILGYSDISVDIYEYTAGMLADVDSSGKNYVGEVATLHAYYSNGLRYTDQDFVDTRYAFPPEASRYDFSSYLVRQGVSVPEPNILVLVGLGIFSLVVSRRRAIV